MSNQEHPNRAERIADGAVAKLVSRFLLPALAALSLYFIKGYFEEWKEYQVDNRKFQEQITSTLKTIETGLAVTVQNLNNNSSNDQRQDRQLEKLTDRLNRETEL